jgi:hypothetical protein
MGAMSACLNWHSWQHSLQQQRQQKLVRIPSQSYACCDTRLF